ncbi:MAG TPA: hypothetical protein VFU63_07705, partial [Ktedonobacterales bacterium]|nr:hypothetical protein [Ktedonobacterales bacterium]
KCQQNLALAVGVISGIAVIGNVFFAQAKGQSGGAHSSISQTTNQPTPEGHMTMGSPAIKPHMNMSDPQLPTFTREDVIAWVSVNPVGRMPALEPPTIVKVEFTPDSEVKKVLGASTGLPGTALVCYVELHGRFAARVPPGSPPRIFKRVWEVFDARTGNVLMAGGSVH